MKRMQQIELILMKLQRSDILVDQSIMLMARVPAARHLKEIVNITR
ncbi:hypothetical protein [Owenweeksia hongkongensis]